MKHRVLGVTADKVVSPHAATSARRALVAGVAGPEPHDGEPPGDGARAEVAA